MTLRQSSTSSLVRRHPSYPDSSAAQPWAILTVSTNIPDPRSKSGESSGLSGFGPAMMGVEEVYHDDGAGPPFGGGVSLRMVTDGAGGARPSDGLGGGAPPSTFSGPSFIEPCDSGAVRPTGATGIGSPDANACSMMSGCQRFSAPSFPASAGVILPVSSSGTDDLR